MSVNIKENGQLVKTAGLNSQTVIIDNLTTQDSTKALSANQGYVLNQNKVDKVTGKGLSTNDYTNEEKTKLAGIGAGAEPNVQSDWKQSDSSSDDFIKNKPTSEIQTSDGQFDTVTGGLMQSCVVDLEPKQSGSGTPSPSNVRAISGHTSVDVWNDPKYGEPITWNQLVQNGNFTSTSNWSSHSASLSVSSNIMKVTLTGSEWNNDLYQNLVLPKSHKILYTFKYRMSTGLSSNAIAFQQGNYTLGGNLPYSNSFVTIARIVQTVTNDTTWIRVAIANNGATLSGQYFEVQNFNIIDLTQLFGTTVADYIYNLEQATTGAGVAYFRNLFPKDYYDYNSGEFTCVSAVNGDTCIQTTINLGGTYYGGTLDAVSGVLTVTHKYTDITAFAMRNGSTANKMFITNPISDARKPSTNMENVYPISNRFSNSKDYNYLYGYTDVGIAFNSSGNVGVAFGSTSEIDTLEKANTWLSSNPLQLVYELATPQTIQLDPQTLETLVGTNDVFAPLVGQSVEEVEFREVMAIDDVIDAIPYESVDPIQVDWFTIFKIHRYGRVVVLKFDDLDASPVVSEDGWAILGRLPERFYHKYPNQMVAENMIFGVINNDNNTLQMKKLIIDQYNGDVKIYFLANEQINPLGSITYILDHD